MPKRSSPIHLVVLVSKKQLGKMKFGKGWDGMAGRGSLSSGLGEAALAIGCQRGGWKYGLERWARKVLGS